MIYPKKITVNYSLTFHYIFVVKADNISVLQIGHSFRILFSTL